MNTNPTKGCYVPHERNGKTDGRKFGLLLAHVNGRIQLDTEAGKWKHFSPSSDDVALCCILGKFGESTDCSYPKSLSSPQVRTAVGALSLTVRLNNYSIKIGING